MDKDVRELIDVAGNVWRYAGMKQHQEAMDAAIARVEARLIPEGHVAVPARDLHELLADIEWEDINRATPEYREAVERLAVIDHEYAQTSIATLLPLTDRERRDAEPPAPETCPECGGLGECKRCLLTCATCGGTGSTDADGGEG